ncbi:unnamed protein product [Diatraea saccharalis]|uniref:Uncharacterized protein n=1 Tax=Diatraea saccharalis TaxID=40085 RepID=A0A9N9R9Z4_9NEOP|nr:unnamed protein product [Diatraea saccharalis]
MAYWTLVIFAFCYVGISALSGKGYYCRDPDTGKLYPVNSTWPSTTFCGNYSCKLRKKDTVKPVIPLREIMIDSIAKKTQARKSDESGIQTEQKKSPNTPNITTVNPTLFTELSTKQSTFSTKNDINLQKIESNDKEMESISSKPTDRYLTESEIKTITHILHSVKKSDLEAIVDIYNLAQDIYKEMDKITSENIIDETLKAAKTKQKESSGKSYWYEPLNRLNKAGSGSDMESQGTNLYPTVTERSTMDPNSYFQGVLSKSDFGAVPYHYPISNFQRENSYMHVTRSPLVNSVRYEQTPCRQSMQYPNYPVTDPSKAYQPPVTSYYQYQPSKLYNSVVKNAYPVETQKVIQPSMLLPYPFSYIQHYNMSTYPYNLYYDGSPWSYFNINNKKNDNNEKYFKANLHEAPKNTYDIKIESEPYQTYKESELNQNTEIKRYTSNKERETHKNDELEPHKDDNANMQNGQIKTKLMDTLFEQAKLARKNKPEWQTDPLTSNVLEEIKAHFDEKAKLLKPFSLRKKAKLERVGKVLKLDDLNRDKRDADNLNRTEIEFDEDLEVYVEKTTCPSQTDLGFYKIGNLTQPYPACCPRRIETNEKD